MRKLIYGSLVFTALSLALLIVASAKQREHFHGTTNAMLETFSHGAKVLAADADGAITQTGNGRVTGYNRDGSKRWSFSFDRFVVDWWSSHFDQPTDATARCAGSCPASFVRIENDVRALGGASSDLAARLEAPMRESEQTKLLGAPTTDRAWLRMRVTGARAPSLLALTGIRIQNVGLAKPQLVMSARDGRVALAAAASGRTGSLKRFVQSGGRWHSTTATISERGMQNACISPDGEWFATVSTRIRIFNRAGREVGTAAQAVSRGTCSIDSGGLTVVTNPASSPNTLRMTRYTLAAKPRWSRYLGTQQLLSTAGSQLIVTFTDAKLLSAYDPTTGARVIEHALEEKPFVGSDGSTVIAGRDGTPLWVAAPRDR